MVCCRSECRSHYRGWYFRAVPNTNFMFLCKYDLLPSSDMPEKGSYSRCRGNRAPLAKGDTQSSEPPPEATARRRPFKWTKCPLAHSARTAELMVAEHKLDEKTVIWSEEYADAIDKLPGKRRSRLPAGCRARWMHQVGRWQKI
jgi:hypothetical protein